MNCYWLCPVASPPLQPSPSARKSAKHSSRSHASTSGIGPRAAERSTLGAPSTLALRAYPDRSSVCTLSGN